MDPFTTEAFTLLGIGLTVIVLRTYTRFHDTGLKGLKSDDYLIWLAAFAFSMETMIAYMLTRFYLRLTEGLEPLGGRVQLGFYLLVITYAVVTSTILFSCGLPFEKNWQIYPEPANSCQTTVSIVNYLVTVTLNIVTDIYLMAIPVPMLLNARLKTIKKLGLCLLFSGGIFVGTAAILRCVLALKDPNDNADTSAAWAVRESFVAILVTNMPVLWPSILRATQAVRSVLLLRYASLPSERGTSAQPVYELRTKKGRRMRKSTYHITTTGGACDFTHTTTTKTTSPGTQGGGEEGRKAAKPFSQKGIRLHIAECMQLDEMTPPVRPPGSEQEQCAWPLSQAQVGSCVAGKEHHLVR
ncbi:hypothetical protein PG999_004732 [Apiospora kogelbergensis]|uniref:Rhodopsin domain-containing protein n=1 Tax=Apiospora kogelbergensis TaxID=1337665 RepID=A0AAW0R031_9PEZI